MSFFLFFAQPRAVTDVPQPRIRPQNLPVTLLNMFLKDASSDLLWHLEFFFLPEKYSTELDFALVRNSSTFHFTFFLRVFLRLAMCDCRAFAFGIFKYS